MNNIDDYLKPRKDPTENQQILFLAEVNRKCPLCGNFLLKEKKVMKKQVILFLQWKIF